MKCFYCTTSLRHSAICCHLSMCSDLSALKCPTRQIQILMGSRILLGLEIMRLLIGGVDLATSAQRFFPMIYYRTDGNVGGVGDADNGRPFTAALTNVNVSETDGPPYRHADASEVE